MKKFNALMIAAIVAVAFTARAEGTAAPDATADKPAATGEMKPKAAKHAKHEKKEKAAKDAAPATDDKAPATK